MIQTGGGTMGSAGVGLTGASSAGASSTSAFPDMTALLDVIFILLVFLLLTANTAPEVLDISLPEDSQNQAHSVVVDQQITINLFSEADRWGLGEQEFQSWELFTQSLHHQVSGALSAAKDKPEIIIAGDKDASLEKTLKLFSWLQQHQLHATQILMTPKQ